MSQFTKNKNQRINKDNTYWQFFKNFSMTKAEGFMSCFSTVLIASNGFGLYI